MKYSKQDNYNNHGTQVLLDGHYWQEYVLLVLRAVSSLIAMCVVITCINKGHVILN